MTSGCVYPLSFYVCRKMIKWTDTPANAFPLIHRSIFHSVKVWTNVAAKIIMGFLVCRDTPTHNTSEKSNVTLFTRNLHRFLYLRQNQ